MRECAAMLRTRTTRAVPERLALRGELRLTVVALLRPTQLPRVGCLICVDAGDDNRGASDARNRRTRPGRSLWAAVLPCVAPLARCGLPSRERRGRGAVPSPGDVELGVVIVLLDIEAATGGVG